MTERIRLASILSCAETIFPAATRQMPCTLTYTNEGEFEPGKEEYLRTHAYAAREVRVAPLVIGKLPRGAILSGTPHCPLSIQDGIVMESIPHTLRRSDVAIPDLCRDTLVPIDLPDECVLLTRLGHGTWGHWLGEILPLAAVAERAFPGRFRFAVFQHHPSYAAIVEQSLAGYGIAQDRLVLLRQGLTYRLLNAWAMTPIWTDFAPHPAALDVMRGGVVLGVHQPQPQRIALIQRATRKLTNKEEIAPAISSFVQVQPETMGFIGQVRLYQSATDIVATIGSGLTGLIYAPDGVRIAGIAPAGWGDQFFYSLGQTRNAHWAEARGPSEDYQNRHVAPFRISPDAVRRAMASAGMVQ